MYHGSNTWKMKCCMVEFQRSRLLLLPKEWDSAGTAGKARKNLPTSYYYGNQHMAKELVGDQDEHSLINWLMTLNYRKEILQMRWVTKSIGKAKLWMSNCGRPGKVSNLAINFFLLLGSFRSLTKLKVLSLFLLELLVQFIVAPWTTVSF